MAYPPTCSGEPLAFMAGLTEIVWSEESSLIGLQAKVNLFLEDKC
jgi:hypothetical protein